MAYRGGGGGGLGFGYALTPWVKRLLIANVVVFFATAALPEVAAWMALVPRGVVMRPWTPFTYMFVHGGFWHILMNMLLLFFFGPPVEQRLGSAAFIRFYLACGLGGALLSFIFAFNAAVIGASGAVMGVMVAFAIYWPDSQIWIWGIFPVPAKWLVTILVLVDLYGAIGASPGDTVAHFAHLGGVAVAFLYVQWWQKRSINAWKRGTSGGKRPMDSLRSKLGRRDMTVSSGGAAQTRRPPPAPRRRTADEERMLDEVDRVLDKISRDGIASLTAEERSLLEEVSRRHRRD